MRLYGKDIKADTLSPLTLAFTGDAVFSLFVREMLVCDTNRPVGKLHKLSVNWVKAEAQSKGMRAILPLLTEKETEVFKRGRNAHSNTMAKNADVVDYRHATGFEALIGYLYVQAKHERISEIVSLAFDYIDNESEFKINGGESNNE